MAPEFINFVNNNDFVNGANHNLLRPEALEASTLRSTPTLVRHAACPLDLLTLMVVLAAGYVCHVADDGRPHLAGVGVANVPGV